MIKIHQLLLGHMKNFSYLLVDERRQECILIDAGFHPERILDFIDKQKLNLSKILLSHGHYDHVNAVEQLLSKKQVPVYLSEKEAPSLSPSFVTHYIADQDNINLGTSQIQALHTPGHTPGGLTFKISNQALITGDTLFIEGCGRCDFANSNPENMYKSLQIIKEQDPNLIIYPGHDYGPAPYRRLEEEKRKNPYLLCDTLTDFLTLRMN
eukprot:COSAG01_NODE_2503_length_7555_cov_3.547881_8_plen_210_part_00